MLLLAAAAVLAATPPLELTDAKGAKHRLSDYRGKVVLVNFWATWCEPCRDELPSIERLRASLEGKPFLVLAVQMGGSARTAQDVADELGLRFPMLLDRDSSVTESWGVKLLPATFLIARDGTVAYSHSGELDWSSRKQRKRIEALLRRSK